MQRYIPGATLLGALFNIGPRRAPRLPQRLQQERDFKPIRTVEWANGFDRFEFPFRLLRQAIRIGSEINEHELPDVASALCPFVRLFDLRV
jgi:hypothetical protein